MPTEIYLQAQHYLAILDYQFWDIAALVGGNSLKIFTVPRDEAVIADLIEGECEFWGMVKTKTPPPIDYDHKRTLELLQRQHRDVKPVTIDAPLDLLPWCATFEDAKRHIKQYKDVENAAKARILETMGTAGALLLPDGTTYNRKTISKAAYHVDAQQYVELRRRSPKK